MKIYVEEVLETAKIHCYPNSSKEDRNGNWVMSQDWINSQYILYSHLTYFSCKILRAEEQCFCFWMYPIDFEMLFSKTMLGRVFGLTLYKFCHFQSDTNNEKPTSIWKVFLRQQMERSGKKLSLAFWMEQIVSRLSRHSDNFWYRYLQQAKIQEGPKLKFFYIFGYHPCFFSQQLLIIIKQLKLFSISISFS